MHRSLLAEWRPPSEERTLSKTTIRRFRWQDLSQWTDLYNEVQGLTATDRAFDIELMRQFLSQARCKAEENCFLAESDGSPSGLLLVSPELPIRRAVASGGVLPSHRGQGIGRVLLNAAMQHATALGAVLLHIQAPADDTPALHLLETAGFQVVRKYVTMRWAAGDVPRMDPPTGFGLRSFGAAGDLEALTELQNTAFGGNWGFCPNTTQDVQARLNFKTCDPEGVLFISHGDRLAAYNWTFRAATSGWIGMTGVHPDYRGKRLGKAVVLAGMDYLVSRGVRNIELESDEQNVQAVDIYRSTGFDVVRRTFWHEKSLSR